MKFWADQLTVKVSINNGFANSAAINAPQPDSETDSPEPHSGRCLQWSGHSSKKITQDAQDTFEFLKAGCLPTAARRTSALVCFERLICKSRELSAGTIIICFSDPAGLAPETESCAAMRRESCRRCDTYMHRGCACCFASYASASTYETCETSEDTCRSAFLVGGPSPQQLSRFLHEGLRLTLTYALANAAPLQVYVLKYDLCGQ